MYWRRPVLLAPLAFLDLPALFAMDSIPELRKASRASVRWRSTPWYDRSEIWLTVGGAVLMLISAIMLVWLVGGETPSY